MADLPIDDTIDVNITNDAGDKKVTVTTDGAKERLDVTLGDELSFQLQAFTPEFHFDVAGVALNTSTDTSLYSETGVGKIDFVAIASGTSNYEVIIKVDGVEILRIEMGELGSDIGLANATNVPLWVETANKNFRYSPKQGVDFTTSFEVLAKATTGTPTVTWLINDRKAA